MRFGITSNCLTPLPPVLFLLEEYIRSYHILHPLQVSRLSQRLQCLPVHDSVDKAAREREEVILKQMEEKEPLPDKEKDQMAWVRAANQHRAIAEEIILKELIYV